MKKKKSNKFWHERAVRYDRLFWTKDKGYLDAILEMGNFQKNDLVLDVGVGSGTVARKIKPHVRHVIGVDISEPMLKKKKWEGISIIKWNICDALFVNNMFDKIIGRMVFHHAIDNVDIAIRRCYDMLKKNGKMVVAEGIPPSDDVDVINWYTDMFKLKEERLTFTRKDLVKILKKVGLRNIEVREYTMQNFSIKNWLINSGLDGRRQKKIMDVHLSADQRIKSVYDMQFVNGDCLINTKNVILVGKK